MSERPKYLPFDPEPFNLDPEGKRFPRRHVFDEEDVDAVNTALAVERPLLIRGKPGAGKSQLALAAAVKLKRAFVKEVVDVRTESRDLLWRFDAIRRMADAHALSEFQRRQRLEWFKDRGRLDEEGRPVGGDELDEGFYIRPGVLWWGLNWNDAAKQAERSGDSLPELHLEDCKPANGVVVLLDEIDKADTSVPNGLLGVLGDGEFSVPGLGRVGQQETPPLVVITTNEERTLPDAFLRRCVVHEIDLEKKDLKPWLIRRGEANFPHLPETAHIEAAELLIRDREVYRDRGLSQPGAAEYLDLLRAVDQRLESADESVAGALATARRFVLRKHSEER